MTEYGPDYKILYKQKVEECERLKQENKADFILRRALELACHDLSPYVIMKNGFAMNVYAIMDTYILQAKKEMEE